ncbi:MAG TPA: hypothetical protein VHR72_01305, partial [Gemmataceae bacterium]|nr:hypothetical protein [Gemmataceae bacterium]
MPQPTQSFRDFGILPDDLPPPPESVRAYFSTGRAVGQYLFTALVTLFGVGCLLLFLFLAPTPMNVLGIAATLASFGVLVYFVIRHDYGAIELDGDLLTATHLYGGWTIQRSLADIERIQTIVHRSYKFQGWLVQKLLGRVKGVEIRFRGDRTKLMILRADPAMTHAQELIEAILARMARMGQLEADVGEFEGQPLVRSIVWRGERPTTVEADQKAHQFRVICVVILYLTMMFGTIAAFAWLQIKQTRDLGVVPAHEISLAELIAKGPGANRHVIVTGFEPDGYVKQEKSGDWTNVWVAVFPPGVPKRKIEAVFESNAIRNEAELRRLLATGRWKGICSAERRTSWGTSLGSELVQANQGLPLDAAWNIDDLREIPSETEVSAWHFSAFGCLIATILLAGLALW